MQTRLGDAVAEVEGREWQEEKTERKPTPDPAAPRCRRRLGEKPCAEKRQRDPKKNTREKSTQSSRRRPTTCFPLYFLYFLFFLSLSSSLWRHCLQRVRAVCRVLFGFFPFSEKIMLRRLVEARLFMPPTEASYDACDRRLGGLYVSTLAVAGLGEKVACATTFDPAVGRASRSDRSRSTDAPLVIYFHGNAEDIGMTAPRIARLASILKVDAMVVEYPGYGPFVPDDRYDNRAEDGDSLSSPWVSAARRAPPSEKAAHATARAAFSHALRQRWVRRSDQIVVWGTSLGGAIAARLAADMSRRGMPPAALILASTFVTARDAARDLVGGPWWRAVGRGIFATADHVPDVACPTLLLHGAADEVIPVRHAGALASTCGRETWWRMAVVPGGTHNDIDDDGFVVPQVRAFLCDALALPAGAS